MPTVEAPAAETPRAAETPHVARIISSDSIPAGGFTPGTILADRYRIIGLLGRGGMGEVYRADDVKLGQPVALKFLPPRLAEDPVRRERFFAEVRITRQLSHPNICRVYDIGEIDGRHFLSMEFIDGEDLASLLKRIGHLTNEKALDIARQLAAGIAAAHERGVLHRDLKPANIMLDGHGRVRITDFGLAIAAEEAADAAEIAGTPAYMAPEQLAGKGATVRSDMYSLGLVLYEIYTGKKAFTAATLAEMREQKETHTPRAISELREGMDPVVERLIRRCMERDPTARPASVAQLALALPGGDPLAAAIAAGETPSPEMVAASGSKEGLRPAVAVSLLTFIILGMIAILAMNDWLSFDRRIPFESRWWTQVLVSWTRLLSGEWTDSLVARDMLIGVALGVALNVLTHSIFLCCAFLFQSFQSPLFVGLDPKIGFFNLQSVMGIRFTINELLYFMNQQIILDLALLIWVLVILRFVLRSQKAAIVMSILLVALFASGGSSPLDLISGLIFSATLFFALMRFGFLAALLCGFINIVIGNLPMTLHASAWYSGYGFLTLAVLAAIVLYAFRFSLGGRALIAPSRFDD